MRSALSKRYRPKKWYALDNSAKIYTGSMSRSWASVFRISVTLTETIDPRRLQQALEITLKRLPLFRMSLHRGMFWYYLDERVTAPPHVEADVQNPCKRIEKKENGGCMFRVRYYRDRIALEVFHSMTDGTGAITFLKTLAAQYLRLCGHEIGCGNGVLCCDDAPRPEEAEDSLRRYARFEHIESRREAAAYRPKLTREPRPYMHILTAKMSVAEVSAAAKAIGVSINDYLAAALCYALYEQQEEEAPRRKKPIKINIPVNMRRYYPSETLRNFSLFVNPGIDPRYGTFTFEETALQFHHFLRLHVHEKKLNAIMSANVGSEKNPIVRVLPLFIKDTALGLSYWMYGESRYSVSMSNLGSVQLPEDMRPYVRRFDFMLGPQRYLPHAAGVISYGDDLYLTVTRTAQEADVERRLFTALVKRGVAVRIESNEVY